MDLPLRSSTRSPFEELAAAVAAHDEWPSIGAKNDIIAAAERFVGAVKYQADAIEHMRRNMTPREQALADVMAQDVPK